MVICKIIIMQFAEALCFLLVLFALPYAAVGRFLRFIYVSMYICKIRRIFIDIEIIITWARLRQAKGELDAINHVRFLYICKVLGHLS